MTVFIISLLLFLILCAVATAFTKHLITTVVIFMSYSLIMSLLWMILESPDLAITEAAVGAGITSILFFITIKKIDGIGEERKGGDHDRGK
ncbi:MAG: DUF4040 domain-containing protein [bacterium]|nr:DUF4040 domain-containing protein [bacterium]